VINVGWNYWTRLTHMCSLETIKLLNGRVSFRGNKELFIIISIQDRSRKAYFWVYFVGSVICIFGWVQDGFGNKSYVTCPVQYAIWIWLKKNTKSREGRRMLEMWSLLYTKNFIVPLDFLSLQKFKCLKMTVLNNKW
jgi:hypothetical protein